MYKIYSRPRIMIPKGVHNCKKKFQDKKNRKKIKSINHIDNCI